MLYTLLWYLLRYKEERLKPFDTFFREQLKLMEKVNTPSNDPPSSSEHYTSFRVGQRVLINFKPYSLMRGYSPKRGQVYVIGRVYTNYTPWVFKLRNSHDGRWEPGYYLSMDRDTIYDNTYNLLS